MVKTYLSDEPSGISDKAYPKRLNEIVEEIENKTFVPAVTFKNADEVENYINQLLASV